MAKNKKQNKLRVFPISITDDMVKDAKKYSTRIAGCPRPKEGSVSHYAFCAISEKLEIDRGVK